MPLTQDISLDFMQQELHAIAALGSGILIIGFGLLGFANEWLAAGQWLLQASILWGYVCLCVCRRLALNRVNAESPLYSDLGWGNRLTILRGLLIGLVGGFLFLDIAAWVPALLYTLAALLDRLDGFVARRNRQVSLLGNELDISFDALGLVVAPLLAIGLGKLHWSYLLLSVAYYVYQWSLQYRRGKGWPEYSLPPNPLRRTLAGFQMGFVAAILWPLFDPALTAIAGVAFMLPVLFGFVLDWQVVCGKLQAQTYSRVETWSERFFQPGLRLLQVLLLFPALSNALELSDHILVVGLLCSAGLMLLGLAGRLGALIMIVLLSRLYQGEIDLIGHLLIVSACWLLLLGTGRYSLGPWGDEWIKRYDGA